MTAGALIVVSIRRPPGRGLITMLWYSGGWASWQVSLIWAGMIPIVVLLIWAVYSLISKVTHRAGPGSGTGGREASITGEIVIRRPAEEVFDFVANERNDPKYNPRLLRSEKVSDGPIGVGTRFAASIRSMGRPLGMLIEITAYERPAMFASTTTMLSATIHGTLTFDPHPEGTLMRWRWQVIPKAL